MRINCAFQTLTKLIAFSLVLPLSILVAGAPKSESAILSATTTRTTLINPAGGNDSGWSSCPADNAVVGFRWSGSTAATAPYSIYCRGLNADGTIPSDSNTTSNSTSVVVYNSAGAANVEWCPGGTVATGVRHKGWSDFALVCNTPPGLGSVASYSSAISTPTDNLCAADSVMMGMGKYTGAWLDSLYAVCKVFGTATLSYNVNTGSGTAPASVTLLIINNPTTTSSSYSGTKSGFTFAGWNTLATGIGTHYDAGASISVSVATTLYAQWNSTITYDANAATSGTVPSPTTATGTSANTTLASNSGSLTRTGYTFAGWNSAADGSGTSYAAGLTTYTSTGNTTLYAQWNSTITYNGNGNTGGSVPTATIAKGSAANTTLANAGTMTRTGYSFLGWNSAADASGTDFASGLTTYQSTGNITLYAKWTRTITYNVNGATSGVPSRSTDVFTNATTPTISTFPTVNTMVRTGYTFAGWSTTTNGVALTAPYATTGEITLYARWTANTYSVIYDTSTVTSGTMADTSFTAGTAFSLRANTFARTGYTFKNWNTDSSGAGTSYTNSQSVTLYAAVTLYPQWNLLAPGIPSVAVSPGNTEVTVTPTAAASSVSVGPPSSFTITAFNSSGVALSPAKTCTVVSPATSCLITGLTNGTTYQFAATATNATNTSASSNKVNGIPAGYLVTFDASANGGTTSTASSTYNKPTALVLPSATKSGYVFSGWYTTSSDSPSVGTLIGGVGASYSPASTITLYARFTGIVYTITYSGNGNTGGTVPSQGTYETGGTAHPIGAGPTKTGYTFASWYTNTTGTGGTSYSAGSSYSSQANLTLYAIWAAAARTVTYSLVGGTSSADTTTLTGKVVGNTVVLPASSTMSKTGYSFTGWSDGTTTYAGGATWTVPASDSNFIITAQWSPLTLSYRYDLNGGTGTTPASGTKNYNESLTLAASTGLAKSGYTFGGWNDGSTTRNANDTLTVTSNIILVAQWSALSYSIIYDGNGSTSGSTSSGSYTAGGVPYSIAANGFVKSGYNFAGWYTNTSGTGGTAFSVGAGYSTASALTLYAQWSGATYTVTYNANGGSGSVPSAGSFVTGSAFTVSTNSGPLAKTGYTFAGWNTSADGFGTNVAESANDFTTTSNVTLYAKWTIISPKVLFNKGTATSVTLPANTSANYGSLYTLPATDTSTVISSVNYAFTGWSDGTNTYQAGSSYRIGSSDVTFTAQWIAIYTVKYVLNGGSGSVPADVLRTDNYAETLTAVVPTKTGFSLSGWKDQSGISISSGSGAWVISATSYIAYAQWTAVQRTLSFSLDSGTGSAPANITGKIIGEIVALPTTNSTKTGYTFGGWSNGGTTYPAGGNFTVGDGNAAFVAVWIQNTNLIIYNGNGATSGTVPATGSYITGTSPGYTVSSNSGTLAKTGFTFAGWYTTATGSGGTAYAENQTGLTTDTNITLYAKWSAASYAVTYSTDGGSTVPTQSDTAYGSIFTLPTAPTKAGFTFLGWQLNSNNYAAGSTFTMGSSAITFIAQWTGVYYAITYALNGGSGLTPTQADVASGGSFTTASAPSRNGFIFNGWSDGATTTNAATLISNLSGNKTLTAQWTIAAPGIPGTPTATPSNGGATITIVAPSSGGTPSSYTVTASPGGATCTVTSPGTSCIISSLTNGTAYTFTSTATNSAGSSTSSSSASSAVTPASVPSEPISVSGSGTGGSVVVDWNTPSSDGGSAITDYIVEYSVNGSNSWSTFADSVSTALSATVTGLIAGNSYIFRITAKNVIGNSLPSISTPIISTLPTAPTVTALTAGNGQVSVSWSAPSHLGSGTLTGDEYEVIAYDSAGNVAGTCKPTSGQTTCTITGLTNGAPYTFKVKAITTAGESALSSASSSVTPATVSNAPSDVKATNSGSSINVTFTAPTDNGGAAITSYTVTSSPTGATCSVGANSTSYICSGLTAATNYTFTVKAINSVGQSSASLASSVVTAVAVPSAPRNVSAVITAGSTSLSATVSFDIPLSNNGSTITSYTVTASPGGATCTVTAPTTYCDIPVLPDQVYTFSATATNAVGTSTASAASLATKATNGVAPTLIVDPIVAPTGNLVENQTLSSNVSVSSFNSTPNSVITYQWQRCTDPSDESTCVVISGATSATYSLTSSDINNYIRVQVTATNSIGTSTNISQATEIIVAAPVSSSGSSGSSGGGGSGGGGSGAPASAAPVTTTTTTSTCDSTCQSAKDAIAAQQTAAKAAADAAAATAKATADAAALAAAKQTITTQQALATQAAQAATNALAAQQVAAAQAAAAVAAAQVAAQKAAQIAAAAKTTPIVNSAAAKAAVSAAQTQATALAQQAAIAVKSASTAAATAVSAVAAANTAQSQLAIQITNIKVNTSIANNSATAAKEAVAIATTQQAAAKAAQANAVQVAAAAKVAADKAAADAAAATAAKIAAEKAAADSAAAAIAQQKIAEKAALEKAAADKAAADAATKLSEAAQNAVKAAEQLTKAATAEEKLAAQSALDAATVQVAKAQTFADVATKAAETKAEVLAVATTSAEKAQDQAASKSDQVVKAAEVVAVKQATVEAAKQVVESVTQQVSVAKAAVATATTNVAAALAVAAKVSSTGQNTSSTKIASTAKVSINNLKPGQRIVVTVNKK